MRDQRLLASHLLRIVGQRLAHVILDASESNERAIRLSRLPTQISSWIKTQVSWLSVFVTRIDQLPDDPSLSLAIPSSVSESMRCFELRNRFDMDEREVVRGSFIKHMPLNLNRRTPASLLVVRWLSHTQWISCVL